MELRHLICVRTNALVGQFVGQFVGQWDGQLRSMYSDCPPSQALRSLIAEQRCSSGILWVPKTRAD